MTSYVQTTAAAPVQQERLNLQTLNWVLPLSYREEQVAVERRELPDTNNGASWSSLLSLSGTNGCTSDDCKAVVKKPKSGTKNSSLDMCTETLGCENGTMYSAEEYKRDGLLCERVLGFPTQEEAEARRRERKAMVERRIIKRVRSGTDRLLPPPALTTRRNRENFLNIVRERANGRMVMYAVRHQSMVTAERSDGRLTLRLVSAAGCSDHNETEEIQDDEDEREGEDYLGVVGKEMNSGGGEEAAEGKKYVFVGRCYKEEEKRNGWTPLMVASAI